MMTYTNATRGTLMRMPSIDAPGREAISSNPPLSHDTSLRSTSPAHPCKTGRGVRANRMKVK